MAVTIDTSALVLDPNQLTLDIGTSDLVFDPSKMSVTIDTSELVLDQGQLTLDIGTSDLVFDPSKMSVTIDTSALVLDTSQLTLDIDTSGLVFDDSKMAVTIDTSELVLGTDELTLDIGTAGVLIDPNQMAVTIDSSQLVLGTDELTLDIGTSDLVFNESQMAVTIDTTELVLDPNQLTLDIGTSGVLVDESKMAVTIDTTELVLDPTQMTVDIGTSNLVFDENKMAITVDTSELELDQEKMTVTASGNILQLDDSGISATVADPTGNYTGVLSHTGATGLHVVVNDESGASSSNFIFDIDHNQVKLTHDSTTLFQYDKSGDGQFDFGIKATSPLTVDADDDDVLTTKSYVVTSVTRLVIDDITDVDNTDAEEFDVLIHDGTSYKNRQLRHADIINVANSAQGERADTAVQPGDATSTLTNNDAFVDRFTDQQIAGKKTFNDDLHVSTNVTVAGNLTISGTTTSVNSTNTEITDSIITLNKGEDSAGVSNPNQSGLEIDRGSASNKFMIWSEANDRFGAADPTGPDSDLVDTTSFDAFVLNSESDSKLYKETFDTGGWATSGTTKTYTVPASRHGIDATAPIIYDITVYDGSEEVGIETSVSASGDVILTTRADTFAGAIRISL